MTPSHLDQQKAPHRASGRAARRKPSGRKPNRSHSAVGAAIVAGAAMAATFAFILTNGTSGNGEAGPAVPVGPTSSAPPPSANTAPSISTNKADRKPPVSTTSAPPVDTGADSPAFRRGQWIAVLDTYPADADLAADQLAKNLAIKLIAAGVPAKAMLADGQYPGLANSNLEPFRKLWIVYVGPAPSSSAAVRICESPKIQTTYDSPACPTYEPAGSG